MIEAASHVTTTGSGLNAGDWAAVGAVGAVIVALVALWVSVRSTRAAERAAQAAEDQTRIQQQLRQDAAQPYVWADVRQSDEDGIMLMLVVGNSGPTIARNVKVKIDPQFRVHAQLQEAVRAQQRLADGIRSLPPGRMMRWDLGPGFDLVPEGEDLPTITITATGPFGPVPELKYVLDMSEYHGQPARATGSLHGPSPRPSRTCQIGIASARHRAAGDTKAESLRALKRRLSDVVYHALLTDARQAPAISTTISAAA